nr:transferrin=peptide 60 [rats, lung, Peptide Partial, 8 aa] [Rattus sp.]
ADAMSLNG